MKIDGNLCGGKTEQKTDPRGEVLKNGKLDGATERKKGRPEVKEKRVELATLRGLRVKGKINFTQEDGSNQENGAWKQESQGRKRMWNFRVFRQGEGRGENVEMDWNSYKKKGPRLTVVTRGASTIRGQNFPRFKKRKPLAAEF